MHMPIATDFIKVVLDMLNEGNGRKMAVSMRKYPVVQGKDAERFLAKTRSNEENIKRIVAKATQHDDRTAKI
jgi:hypothetical protein